MRAKSDAGLDGSRPLDGVEVRLVLPSDTLPSGRPDYFTQRNCGLLGLNPRQFLELLRRPDSPPVARVGKLRMVRRKAMLTFLDRMASCRKNAGDDGSSLDGADEVLREIGAIPLRKRRRS